MRCSWSSGPAGDEILDKVDLSDAIVIENPEWEEGMASSLRVGLDAVLRLSRADAVGIFLGDQPDISEEVVTGLLDARRSTKRQAIVPKYRYVWGNPVCGRKVPVAAADEFGRRRGGEAIASGPSRTGCTRCGSNSALPATSTPGRTLTSFALGSEGAASVESPPSGH